MVKKIVILWLLIASLALMSGVVSRVSIVGVQEDNISRYSSIAEISGYDDLFREFDAKYDIDWRLLSAIAYVESRFRSNVTSQTGARGLMQVMPRIAYSFGFDPAQLYDERVNLEAACMLLQSVEQMLRFGSGVSERDSRSIVLACYNGGIGHVLDARRLAQQAGVDGNRWHNVRHSLLHKNLPEYQLSSSVHNGKMYGAAGTVRYVEDVMRAYDEYCSRISRHSAEQVE